MTKRAASLPVRDAMWASRERVVGSSWKTSSRRVQDWVAASMDAVGVVTVSPEGNQPRALGKRKGGVSILRKSKAADPGVDQALVEDVERMVCLSGLWPLTPLVSA